MPESTQYNAWGGRNQRDWVRDWTGRDTATLASLCTLDDLKARIGIDSKDTAQDEILTRIILGVEAILQRQCNRSLLLPSADVTEYYTGHCDLLRVDRYPIASITSIKESYDYDWDNATALVADTDYRANGAEGILKRLWGSWCPFYQGVQIVYQGGYCAAGVDAAAGQTELPADLREAAIQQAAFIYKRRDDIGLVAVSYDGGSISKMAQMDLLPMVKSICEKYRRIVL